MRSYNECQAVEQALRNQVIDAIPPEYLDSLRNSDTDMINCSIPDLITFLQTNYCRITDQELSDKEDELKATVFDPQQPVDLIFNKIKLFSDLCTMTGNTKTDRQLVQLGYLIFNRTRAYMDALKVWNAKPQADRTYLHFQTHLRNEFHALRQVGALRIQDSSVNMLQEVRDQMNQRSVELGTQLNETMRTNFMEAFRLLHPEPPNEEIAPPQQALNVQTTTPDVMAVITRMQTTMDDLTARLNSTAQSLATNTPNLVATDNTINPRTGRTFKRYCWSCGCCVHWGRHCSVKKRGHKNDATFKDRKGGSDEGCMPNRA